jgi:hypothetical protein
MTGDIGGNLVSESEESFELGTEDDSVCDAFVVFAVFTCFSLLGGFPFAMF